MSFGFVCCTNVQEICFKNMLHTEIEKNFFSNFYEFLYVVYLFIHFTVEIQILQILLQDKNLK